MSDDAKQAMLNRKVEALEATVAQQQKQIQALTAGLQKVSAQLAARVRPVADLKRANSPLDESAVADLRRKWSSIRKSRFGKVGLRLSD